MCRAPFCLTLLAALAVPSATAATGPPRLLNLSVWNGSTPFAGDGKLLATVSPNGDGFRDAAHVRFWLTSPARISLAVVQTDTATSDPEAAESHVIQRIRAKAFAAGSGQIVWAPKRTTPPRTYVLRLTVTSESGRRVYGLARPGASPRAPVVRVQGIEAGFLEPSYAPGQEAALEVATDAKTLTFQVFAYGGGAFPSVRDVRTSGQAMTAAARVDWAAHRDAPSPIRVVRPGDWPSGLYFLRITAGDGRIGYAPFVVRPRTLGTRRIAVVLATGGATRGT
jgi:hypothetical protein